MHVVIGSFAVVIGLAIMASEYVYVRPRPRGWAGPLTEGDAR